jgi:hypothetical protein
VKPVTTPVSLRTGDISPAAHVAAPYGFGSPLGAGVECQFVDGGSTMALPTLRKGFLRPWGVDQATMYLEMM